MPTSFLPPDPLEVEYDDPLLRVRVSLPRLTFDRRTVEVLGFSFTIVDPFSVDLEFQDRFAGARLPLPEEPPSLSGVIDTVRDEVVRPAVSGVRRRFDRVTDSLRDDVGGLRSRVDGVLDRVDRRVGQTLAETERLVSGLAGRVDGLVATVDERVTTAVDGLTQRLDETTAALRSEVNQVVGTVDRKVSESVEAVRQEVFGEIPSGFIEDPVKWSFSTTIGYIEDELGNGVEDQLVSVLESVLEELLAEDTKQRLRDRARDE
jgi:hypothetical protein